MKREDCQRRQKQTLRRFLTRDASQLPIREMDERLSLTAQFIAALDDPVGVGEWQSSFSSRAC
jgi:hypothetical protein